jgi:hypothetical protein
VEEKAIRTAFQGLEVGELPVSIYFCTFHTTMTFNVKFGKDRIYELMIAAMYSYTSIGAEQNIDKAFTSDKVVQQKYTSNQLYLKFKRVGRHHR